MSKKTKTSETGKRTYKKRVKPGIEETYTEGLHIEDLTIEEETKKELEIVSPESVLAISWYQNSIRASLLGEFKEILKFSEADLHLTPDALFQLIYKLQECTKLSILINDSGYKTGYSEFVERLQLYFPHLVIKRMNVPLNSSDTYIMEIFMKRLDWKFLEDKTIIPLSK